MNSHRSPRWIALLVASLGVVATGVHHALLFWYPQRFLTDAAQTSYLDAWFTPVTTIGLGVRFLVIPLAAASGAFYLVYVCEEPIRRVTGWFLLAGLVFGLGVLCLDWLVVTPPSQRSLGVVLRTASFTVLSVVLPSLAAAAIGRVSADGVRAAPT